MVRLQEKANESVWKDRLIYVCEEVDTHSFTIWPGPNSPRFPPLRPDGQDEYMPANSANLTGSLPISSFMSSSLLAASAPPYNEMECMYCNVNKIWENNPYQYHNKRD